MCSRLACLAVVLGACGRPPAPALTIATSAVGAEGRLLAAQLARFEAQHPGLRVEIRDTPDSGDQRHQLFVEWLNAGSAVPDVLQLDVVWTAEMAAAGWIRPLDDFGPEVDAFFPATVRADRWQGTLYAVPWFADVGMLYYRTDLAPRAPTTWAELVSDAAAAQASGAVEEGFVWQGARYEGLTCTFLELLGAHGGSLDDVDSPAALAALEDLRGALVRGISPAATLTYAEEQTRFAFQNGRAAFMRNWPYALPLVDDPAQSRVAGRVAVAPMPAAPGGHATAALGGSQLAVNARSRRPDEAWALIRFLTAPEQMRERAQVVGQYPTRPALYDDPALAAALHAPPATVRAIIAAAEPRPVTPLYSARSERLQVELHAALSGQIEPRVALQRAARAMHEVDGAARPPIPASPAPGLALLAVAAVAVVILISRRRRAAPPETVEPARGWRLVAPALLLLALVLAFPLGWTFWESLHAHDLRFADHARTYIGAGNFVAAVADARFRAAVLHTAAFTAISVTVELVLGLALALVLDRAFRGRARGAARTVALLPWALPTVVAALLWRFWFEGAWLAGATTAWVPILLADVWKTTPFTALLLLTGLQGIDPALYEAAAVDGAGPWRRLVGVTLPLLRPTILVTVLLRALDAFRVFDLVYVITGGGPGDATEPLALYTFHALLAELRFGYGAALSVLVFLVTFGAAVVFVRLQGVPE